MKFKRLTVNKEDVIQSLKNAGMTVVENEGSPTQFFNEDQRELIFPEDGNIFGFIMSLPKK